MNKKLTIGVIAGEESGDILASDLINQLKDSYRGDIVIFGVGGDNLKKQGLESIFEINEISIVGLSQVIRKLPKILNLIKATAQYFLAKKIDLLIVVDSPDFTHRVAKIIRKKAPQIPIVQYVAPSVWAWREHRAAAMKSYIDLILSVLPFEPKVFQKLNGPKTVYVGHRLISDEKFLAIYNARKNHLYDNAIKSPYILLLPGSRISEIKQLLPEFKKAVENLNKTFPNAKFSLVTLDNLKNLIVEECSSWEKIPEIFLSDHKESEFLKADVALAASGTVSLELSLSFIPTILVYKLDILAKMFIQNKIKIWTAALPNIIMGLPIIREFFNEFATGERMSKEVEFILKNEYARNAQLIEFEKLRKKMQTELPPSQMAAKEILNLINNKV